MDGSYQRNAIRSKFTQNIAATFDTVRDELVGSLNDFIPMTDRGMFYILLKSVPMIQVHCRVGQGIIPTNHAMYRLVNIESGG